MGVFETDKDFLKAITFFTQMNHKNWYEGNIDSFKLFENWTADSRPPTNHIPLPHPKSLLSKRQNGAIAHIRMEFTCFLLWDSGLKDTFLVFQADFNIKADGHLVLSVCALVKDENFSHGHLFSIN